MSNIFEYSITNPILRYYSSYTDFSLTDNQLEVLHQKGCWKTLDDLVEFLAGKSSKYYPVSFHTKLFLKLFP